MATAPKLLTDEQLYQMTGSWEAAAAARDQQNRALNIYNDAERLSAASSQPPTQAQLTTALVNLLQTDPNAAYGDIVKAAATQGITPQQVQATFGTLPAGNDRTYVPDYTPAQTTTINNAIASTDPIAQAWGRAEQTGDYGQIAALIKDIPAPTLLSKYGLTNKDISYIYSRPTVKDPLSTAFINAEKTGDYTGIAGLLTGITPAQLKSTYNLNQADIDYISSRAGIAGKLPSTYPTFPTTPTTPITVGGTTPVTPTTVTGTQTPTGQFRELFPSFAESKRLAGQMVAGRPTTESIISMINSNAARPVTVGGVNYSAPESAAFNAYRSGNMPEFNRLTQLNQLTAPAMQTKFGLSDADMAYITNNAGGVFYNPTSTQQAAPTSLNNVLSMISK